MTDTEGGRWQFVDTFRATVPTYWDDTVHEDGEFGLFPME